MSDAFIKEAARLHALGFGVHWLKPGSKAPVKGGWSGGTRDALDTLRREYSRGYGLGVRLGEPSNLGDGFLAVIDLDVKTSDPRHYREALAVIDREFPGLRDAAPFVASGRGNGSGHFYVKTRVPVHSGKLGASPEEGEVFSPSSEITKRQRAILSAEKLERGFRLKAAWEVEFMSIGKQVVLPPTPHADTKVEYKWARAIESGLQIPLVKTDAVERRRGVGRPTGSAVARDFSPVEVDLVGSKLSDAIVNAILSGTGVSDRSRHCYLVCIAMLKAGFDDAEILSVLTDKANFLGETGFDHRKTSVRGNAAEWVRKYCLDPAREDISAERAFENDVEVLPALSDEAAEAQRVELAQSGDWRSRIERGGKDGAGPPKATLENVILILTGAVAADIFKRDLFTRRESYGVDTPWGGKRDVAITDTDAALIKHWLGRNYRFEPSTGTIFEAIDVIAELNAFHPIRQMLEALPEWDGTRRIDTWLANYFEAKGPSEYLAQVFRKFLLAAVTRVYEPGTKFDWMMILEGAQGIGKSSFGKILAGGKFFTDWLPDLSDKDAAQTLQGIWIVEMGELAQLKKNEIETVKGFLTREVDKYRPSFGRKTIEAPRQCVFLGSTNSEEYLRDDSGNRRFVPVRVGQLDFEKLARDRDQLFAEALDLYRYGGAERLDLSGAAAEHARAMQQERMVTDDSSVMVEHISTFILSEKNKPGDERFPFEKFKLHSLFEGIAPLSPNWRLDGKNIQFAAKAVKKLGGEKRKIMGENWWILPI